MRQTEFANGECYHIYNRGVEKAILTNTQPKTIAATKTEVQGVSDTKEETTNPETATPIQEEPISKPSFEQPQPTKTGHWWNPFSWF